MSSPSQAGGASGQDHTGSSSRKGNKRIKLAESGAENGAGASQQAPVAEVRPQRSPSSSPSALFPEHQLKPLPTLP